MHTPSTPPPPSCGGSSRTPGRTCPKATTSTPPGRARSGESTTRGCVPSRQSMTRMDFSSATTASAARTGAPMASAAGSTMCGLAALLLVAVAALPVARAAAAAPAAPPAGEPAKSALTAAAVLAASSAADWRPLDAQHTLYLELPAGRVVIELAPRFAPKHVANVEALVRAKFFDGLSVVRVQDNYVVQWGDADARKPLGAARRTLAAEFERPLRGLAVTRLPDADTYAPQVGFVDGFPVALDPGLGRAWLVHCYGMVGAGRDTDVDSGGGAELYAVIGQAPRHL